MVMHIYHYKLISIFLRNGYDLQKTFPKPIIMEKYQPNLNGKKIKSSFFRPKMQSKTLALHQGHIKKKSAGN